MPVPNIYQSSKEATRGFCVLSMMSPALIRCVAAAIAAGGTAITSDIARSGSSLRPLAIMDPEFVPDEAIEHFSLGFATIIHGAVVTSTFDREMYTKVLKNAYHLPDEIATAFSKGIETYDPLSQTAGSSQSWYSKLWKQMQEGLRRTANVAGSMFGWENDQDQGGDLDRLFEITMFGRVCADLHLRHLLMAGQFRAAISGGFGLPVALSGSKYMLEGDPSDPYGDLGPISSNRARYASLALLLGTPYVASTYPESLRKGVLAIRKSAADAIRALDLDESDGRIANPTPSAPPYSDPGVQRALRNARFPGLKSESLETLFPSLPTGDPYADDQERAFAGELTQRIMAGDISGAFDVMHDFANDPSITTGDPLVDQQIYKMAVDPEYGDPSDDDYGPEMGGLFKKIRAKLAIKRANRKRKRSAKRAAKEAALDEARAYLADIKAGAYVDQDKARFYTPGAAVSAAQAAFEDAYPVQNAPLSSPSVAGAAIPTDNQGYYYDPQGMYPPLDTRPVVYSNAVGPNSNVALTSQIDPGVAANDESGALTSILQAIGII